MFAACLSCIQKNRPENHDAKIRPIAFPFTSFRRLHQLSLIVLMLYLMTLGVAVASPVMSPQAMAVLCTSTGVKVIDLNAGRLADGSSQSSKASASMAHLLDCPMCVTASLQASIFHTTDIPAPHLLSDVLQAIPAARLASFTAAPLPARGPPDVN